MTAYTDASRFLAQSQSRISFRQPEESTRNPLERPRRQDPSSSRQPVGRSYFQRPAAGNPYHGVASHLSQFPFASRSNAPPAPLFYSATDALEDNDEAEHEREVADFYALQRSRRQFVESRLDESSEAEDDGSCRGSGLGASGDGRNSDERGLGRIGGIKSSWKGGKSSGRLREKPITAMDEVDEGNIERVSSEGSSTGKGKMYDVGLESTMRSGLDEFDTDEPPADLAIDISPDDDPPSIQNFRKPPRTQNLFSPFIPLETDDEIRDERPPPPDSDLSSVPPTVAFTAVQPPRHDAFWGNLYLITLASLFASFLLVYLHTSTPSTKNPLGDTVYTTMQASFHLLAVDTLVAIIVSLLWLALLRSYVRPLVYLILTAVPVILFSFSLYPLISSYSGPWEGASIQDRVMRYLSPLPAAVALAWVYGVYQGRHAFGKAIGILEFACRILAANPALLLLGFGTLGGVVAWTWLWMGMFTRVFLGGHLSSAKNFFIIDLSTWWLGVFFILVYLWTLAVGSGIQRATTAATVSQWYFHRLAVPAPTSRQVVQAALGHSSSTLFGSICLSSLLGLLVRLPIIVLPRRVIALVGLCTYTLLPTSITTLTHPTTLTYSAIHSQPLAASARAVAQLPIMSPSTGPSAVRRRGGPAPFATSILPYNIALLLLHATRLITSFAFGFGAWVSTARSLVLTDAAAANTIRGSLYAYIVGLIAGAIGWAILGAMEGVLTGVVDAVVVCWASEVRNGEVRYCREAGYLLGGERQDGEREGLMGG
ncbi:hypothetical protein MMC32_001718 [Xylographa parallela]|nr:hypothetical protein [Xylographa parallela]